MTSVKLDLEGEDGAESDHIKGIEEYVVTSANVETIANDEPVDETAKDEANNAVDPAVDKVVENVNDA